jgi:hypothetical protein
MLGRGQVADVLQAGESSSVLAKTRGAQDASASGCFASITTKECQEGLANGHCQIPYSNMAAGQVKSNKWGSESIQMAAGNMTQRQALMPWHFSPRTSLPQ